MKKILQCVLLVAFGLASVNAFAQERVVTGRVTSSEDGSTVPGVNVTIKGTTSGTVTDVNGAYSLSVPANATIVFSFIGFVTQEIPIGERTSLNVAMVSDVLQLSEVVVTGYGVQEKRTLSGSVASVKGDVFENVPIQSMDRALQGRAAGVQIAAASGQPGGALTVRVRGVGSINASNDPLWIVDGVQLGRFGGSTQGSSNPLGSINPNDIESIDVLKDAAAAAIYGAQAANGVIIVTTKKGKKGATTVELTAQYGVVKPMNLYEMTDAKQFATLKEEAFINAGQPLTGPSGAHTLYGDPNDANLANYDWVNKMFQDASLGTYGLSIAGGDEKTTFRVSGQYEFQEGQIIMSDWKRGTTRININHKVSDRFTLGANLSLAYQRTFGSIANGNFVNGPFQAAFTSQPTSPAFDDNGRYNPYPVQAPGSHLFGYNIVQGVNEEVRLGRTVSTVSSMTGSFKVMEGLYINGMAGVDFSDNRDDNQRPSTIPVFAGSGGQVFVRNRRTENWNTNITANYSKKIADVHNVSGIVGYEYKEETRTIVDASQFNYSNPYFRLLSAGSTARPAAEFYNENRRQGIFAQAKYTYNDKYIADFTIRRDGSSRFGKNTRYGTFYAGSAAWRITEENFMSGVTFLDDLKLRVAYGVVGNSDIGDYDGLTSFGSRANAGYLGGPVLAPTRLGNDILTWEDETQFNVGVDFALFGNRLTGAVEYYNNVTNNLLFDVPLPTDSGFGTVKGNSAEVLNRGFEIELGGVILDRAGFKWNANFNLGTVHNELLSLPGGQERIGNSLIVGEPINFLYLFEFAGVNPANGKAMIYDTLGNLSYDGVARDAAVRGSTIPTYFGGLSNSLSYKGLTLDVFFQFQGGNKATNGDLYNLYASGSSANNQLVSQMDRWQQPGDITNMYRPYQGGVIDGYAQNFGSFGSTQFMSDAGYIRLKQVTLSYQLPSSIISKIGMKKANIFVQGLNLLTWSKFDGIDPEVISNNNNNGLSSYGVYPLGRQYGAGLTLGF